MKLGLRSALAHAGPPACGGALASTSTSSGPTGGVSDAASMRAASSPSGDSRVPDAVAGPARTPMPRTAEPHRAVEALYARAYDLEVQPHVIPVIGLDREASRRGIAASSPRPMQLHAVGAPGVARDHRVAVFFKERAVRRRADVDPAWRR